MKLHILYQFMEGPYGGGNQFLKALREELRRHGSYSEQAQKADCLLVNLNPGSLPFLFKALRRRTAPQTVLARADGPISLVRGKSAYIDRLLADFVTLQADGVVWQSTWSREQNKKLVKMAAPAEAVIHNAVDPKIFFAQAQRRPGQKIKLIATSWSPNPRKGFVLYNYLDQQLDFSRYDMTFIGNTPIVYKNIRVLPPMPSAALAEQLRAHDIYVTASQHDPCSNALLEALACGLPAVALADGGHPELLRQDGELFHDENDVLAAIAKVAANLPYYHSRLPVQNLLNTAKAYLGFAQRLTPHTSSSLWQQLGLISRYYGYQAIKFFSGK